MAAKEVFKRASGKIQLEDSDGEVCYGTVPLDSFEIEIGPEATNEIEVWNRQAAEFEKQRKAFFTRMLGEQAAKKGGHKVTQEDVDDESVLGKAIATARRSPSAGGTSDGNLSDLSMAAAVAPAAEAAQAPMETDIESRKRALIEGCEANIASRRRTRGKQSPP